MHQAGNLAQHRFLVVDDHPFVVEAVSTLIKAIAPQAEILQAFSVARMHYHLSRHSQFCGVFLDLELPDASGCQAVEIANRFRGDAPIVVFSARTDFEIARRCLELGVRNFLPKTVIGDQLNRVIKELVELSSKPNENSQTNTCDMSLIPEYLGFTNRQREVAALLATGVSNKVIARKLDIAPGTVKIHVGVVLNRLGVGGRAEVMTALLALGVSRNADAA